MRKTRFIDAAGRVATGNWTAEGIETDTRSYDPTEVEILPPTEPTKVIGVGPNYESNVLEKDDESPRTPGDLLLFVKPPNTLVGHGGVSTFEGEGEYCFELELGVVIGEQCRNVSRDEAMDVIAGFTCLNEITDLSPPESRYDPANLVRAKAIDDATPIGPVLAKPEDVPDDATMELRVDGEVKQRTNRSNCVFSEAAVIEEITSYLTLEPGDVIATGSATGVAQLSDGDWVEIEIEGIGTLEHAVRIDRG
ncbi:fumarylacetoacetate hydrolase family protein [Natronosalvus caseinilyticus]|uniref:fumarylacetoacetate hydrolase family protein n=1 Tax=Natronosalvus caseinilyticus TaxID=2953747 RepID=UPI0028A8244D|nr:fumarylacetoacetate hydrolase family protein [Natronosalvus caseinilyticus]